MSISHFLQHKLAFTALLLFLHLKDFLGIQANAESKVHIVYMGIRQHDDVELATSAHHQILTSVLGSREAARDSIIYSYKHGFSGFAARLTKFQAKKIADLPDVVRVVPNYLYTLHTTRSWDYLGLSESSPTTNLLHEANMGDSIIIGVLDTGIWPESEVFNDKGLGPIPSRWKGHCQSGAKFDPAKACNRKLIGAKYYLKGFEAEAGRPAIKDPDFLKFEFASPRDRNGHGTHTSSTAGGLFAPNASYHGLGYGTVRGGAPKARIAMYKVCWNWLMGGCTFADIMMAIDEAIHDGVDILSLSLGMNTPQYADVDMRSGVAFASFHAVTKGITVVCSGGNEGPIPQTVDDTSPWLLTVAASSIDRSFPTLITLGNNRTFAGQSLYTGKETGFISIAHPESSELEDTRFCDDLNTNDTWAAGKVVLCFLVKGNELDLPFTRQVVQEVGGLGLIVAMNPARTLYYFASDFPSIGVSIDVGAQLLDYIRYSRKPQVKLSPSRTHVGKPVSTHIASFSSRGPNSVAPAILKPDIAAPGVNILAAIPSEETPYKFESGTSMAAPHVSGIVALLKSLHPHWSPAAIKSALITTAWQTDPHSGEPIIAEGNPNKIADPFDFGGGLVNANGAKDPGLVYDMGTFDYILYLCSMGYNNSAISMLIDQAASCPIKRPSILDVNLPSVTIPSLKKTVTVRRTVTNVGPVNSNYKAIIEHPLGITIKVKPETLIFNSSTKKISFTLTISTTHKYTTDYYFGSLTWTDEVHRVHIVYMGRRQHDDLELTTSAHHQILTSVLVSPEAARDSIIYSFKHGFSGFAAKLTKSQAKKIAELPDVVHVIPNHLYKLHTTRSWDYLGLSTSSPPTNLLHEANMGDGIIIGVLDTGIWPKSEAFNDKGLGPIPSKWKGHCRSGTDFDPAKACNRKLIGAKYFLDGLEAELGRPIIKDPTFLTNEFASPMDRNGHGTHTSSTVGGSFAPNASYRGLAYGTVRGGAPKAQIAMYKVCWSSGVCDSADIIKGIDEAIHDGVDFLTVSIGLLITPLMELEDTR